MKVRLLTEKISMEFQTAAIPRAGEYIHLDGTQYKVMEVEHVVSDDADGLLKFVYEVVCACEVFGPSEL